MSSSTVYSKMFIPGVRNCLAILRNSSRAVGSALSSRITRIILWVCVWVRSSTLSPATCAIFLLPVLSRLVHGELLYTYPQYFRVSHEYALKPENPYTSQRQQPPQTSLLEASPYKMAESILREKGFEEVEWAPPRSPYDMKARHGDQVWFVEVRSRSPSSSDSHRFILPAEKIGSLKTLGRSLLLLIRGAEHRLVDTSMIDGARLRGSVVALSLREPGREWSCLRCSHRWKAKGLSRPTICPRCKSPYYDRPRRRRVRVRASPRGRTRAPLELAQYRESVKPS